MLDQSSLTGGQIGGGLQTTNPQAVPPSDLQPQQPGLQSGGSQVLGTATILEQSNTSSVAVDGTEVQNEINQLQNNQTATGEVQGMIAGREGYVIIFSGLLIAVLAYVLVKKLARERSAE